jgi:neutral ceramidase
LADLGVTEVVALGYANAYAGYVTTPEEYAEQDYEGASTHFGKWTLPAYLTLLKELAGELRSGAHSPDETLPPHFSSADLAERSYRRPAGVTPALDC